MSGVILGLSYAEIDARFDEIVAFADIGDFINQPVKTYSSGMFVRLAFAVQACVEPDILIIDEALSVGDIFFQQKCAKRMQQLREKGTSLIFVSHDMGAIRDLCDTTLYLKQGKMIFGGETSQALQHYFLEDVSSEAFREPTQQKVTLETSTEITQDGLERFREHACWFRENEELNNQDAQVLAVSVFDSQNLPTMHVQMGESVRFQILYRVYTEEPVHVTVILKNRYDQIVNSSGSYTSGIDLLPLRIGAYAVFELNLACTLEAGRYTFCVTLGYASKELPNRGIVIDETSWLGPLQILWNYEQDRAPWLGMVGLPCSAKFMVQN